MKHNAQQLGIINALGKDIIVAASAGAGKTTVLISRLMKRIQQDHLSVDQICAMTFTKKAAAEMKKRLAIQLNVAYQQERSPFLYSQLQQLETAQISTIHSFCLSIISEFGYLIGFDSARANNLLGDDAQRLLSQQAIDQVFETYYRKSDRTFIELSQWFSASPLNIKEFQSAILRLYTTSQIHLDSSQYLDNLLVPYLASSFEQLPESYQETYRHYQTIMVEKYLYLLEVAENAFLDETENQVEDVYAQLQEMEAALTELLVTIKTKSLSEIEAQAKKTFSLTIKTIRGETVFNEARKALLESFQKGNLDSFLYAKDLEIVNPQQISHITLMIELTKAYGLAFESLKQQAGAIDFNDIEHLAYQILQYDEARDTLKERYEEILVDEFQDSNFFQEAIVNLISRGNNVFRVGDVKQSIYGFRHAKPDIMRGHLTNPMNEVFYLSNNFRSKENIVEFNNMVFSQAMNIDEFKDTYGEKDAVSVGVPIQREDQLPVFIHLPENDQTITYASDDSEETVKSTRLIAMSIAKDIQRQANRGKSYRDICVLIRSHSRKAFLKDAFDELDIPYYFDAQEGFTHAYSVQDILNAIRLCLDPTNEFYLAYFLLSQLGGYDEVQVASLRLHSSDSLLTNLKSTDPDLHHKLQLLINQFNTASMSQALTHLYAFNDYYHAALPLEQKSNLDLLFERVTSYESTKHEGWPGFISQMEFIEDGDKSASAVAIDENEDVVKVLTIHQSKGLQFPIVYYFSSSNLRIKSLDDNLLIDGDMGIAFKYYHGQGQRKHLLRRIIEQKIELDEIEESLRLLYVALTRAQNELHIVDVMPQKEQTEPISSYSLLAKEGHTPTILRSLDKNKPELYTFLSEQIEIIPERKSAPTPVPAFKIPDTPLEIKIVTPQIVSELDLNDTLSSTEKGTYLHQLLEAWPAHHFSDEFIEGQNLSNTSLKQLRSFRENPLTQKLHDQSFGYEVGYATVDEVGVMDFVSENDQEITLVDFKSDRVSNETILIERYRAQLSRYHKILSELYPHHEIVTAIYSLTLMKYVFLTTED